jgi:hypothetical protein
MIHGAHVIVYSKDAEADRAFFRDVLRYPYADAGHGWLIFALPPAEIAVHPSDENDVQELYLMCDDVHALIAEMKAKRVMCSAVHEERWGSITNLTLPGGGKIGVYQPKHPSPLAKAAAKAKAGGKAKPSKDKTVESGTKAKKKASKRRA